MALKAELDGLHSFLCILVRFHDPAWLTAVLSYGQGYTLVFLSMENGRTSFKVGKPFYLWSRAKATYTSSFLAEWIYWLCSVNPHLFLLYSSWALLGYAAFLCCRWSSQSFWSDKAGSYTQPWVSLWINPSAWEWGDQSPETTGLFIWGLKSRRYTPLWVPWLGCTTDLFCRSLWFCRLLLGCCR